MQELVKAEELALADAMAGIERRKKENEAALASMMKKKGERKRIITRNERDCNPSKKRN